MQREGKERRKRKDPESRDFSCPCGKSYLSYAAAYTHAKHKHEGDKAMIEGIRKPEREQLKRGRPKEKKASKQTTQTAKLTLIESTILKICQQLEGAFPHAVLEGNEERNEEVFEKRYDSMCEEYSKLLPELDTNVSADPDFLRALIKDFNAEVAARVKFACVILSNSQELVSVLLKQLNSLNIWQDHKGINEAIAQSLKEWSKYASNGLQMSSASQGDNFGLQD